MQEERRISEKAAEKVSFSLAFLQLQIANRSEVNDGLKKMLRIFT